MEDDGELEDLLDEIERKFSMETTPVVKPAITEDDQDELDELLDEVESKFSWETTPVVKPILTKVESSPPLSPELHPSEVRSR